MERRFDSMLSSYEEEISLLDSQQWEQDLPRISDLQSMRKTSIKREMIDVDLVRGSTFPKSKVGRGTLPLLLRSVLSLVFFPLQYSWWVHRTSKHVYTLGCVAYCSLLLNLALHYHIQRGDSGERGYSDNDILEPVIMFGILVFLQTYIYSSSGKERGTKQSPPSFDELSTRYSRRLSRIVLPERKFSWQKRKLDSQLFSCQGCSSAENNNRFFQELASDADSTFGNMCSDVESLAPSTQTFDAESCIESISENETSRQKPRKLSKEKMRKRFKSSRENSRESASKLFTHPSAVPKIGCTVWNNEEPFKISLSALEIGSAILERSREMPDSNIYAASGVVFAVFLALLPAVFRLDELTQMTQSMFSVELVGNFLTFISRVRSFEDLQNIDKYVHIPGVILLNLVLSRLILLLGFFFLLTVTERAYRRRFLIAKLFSHITSTRRSMKSGIPHFRLYKVRNIKAWLCVRSFLRKRGPKRSIELIVSVAFSITLLNILYLCNLMLKEDEATPEFNPRNCEVICSCLFIGCFLLRFITLSTRINQKYWNPSVLLTEQINIYLRSEEKPQKKDQLLLANNVLKLSSDLIKELDRPYNFLGYSSNPLIYNIVKLLLLSAVSGALSEMLGFKLKLYKVKLK